MRRKWLYLACLLVGAAAWGGAIACAQTDIAASIDGAFSGNTQAGVDVQSPSNSAGALLEVRHIHNSLVGFEGAYSYNRANQTYAYTVPVSVTIRPPCPYPIPVGCGTSYAYAQPVAVSANAHAITGDWVVSRKMRSFRPFALAGGGLLLVVPSSGQRYTGSTVPGQTYINVAPDQMSTNIATEFLFVFGAGLDWKLSSHIGLRLQDRDTMYKSPQLFSTDVYPVSGPSTKGLYTYTQEPVLGVYYRF